MSRLAFKRKDFDDKPRGGDFDTDLNIAISSLKKADIKSWEKIMGYLRSLVIPYEVSPELSKMAEIEYHKKAAIAKIIKRFQSFEEIKGE